MQNNNLQQTLDRAAETSLKVQEASQNAGMMAGQMAVGVTAAAGACLFRIFKGAVQGGIQGGRVGVGKFVEATRETLVRPAASDSSAAFCGSCGNTLQSAARFCSHCGTPQGQPASASE